jgi:hypothetical protein
MGMNMFFLKQRIQDKRKKFAKTVFALCRFDNSGHRLRFPGWQSNQTNIARTNNIIKSIASEFGPQYEVVSAIEPMNEFVSDLLLCPWVL